MFGGFGGFGGPPPGAPGMNVNMTTTTHHTTTSSAGGQEDPGKKSQELQDRYKHREAKLPTYIALVDVLEIKGENVVAMRDAAEKAKMTPEDMAKGQAVFEQITAAVMSFDFAKIMQYNSELMELERIDDEHERQFKKLEMLLKGFDKYEEIRQEFGIVHTTFTTHATTQQVPLVSATITTPQVGILPASTLEARVVQLETNYATLKAEFEAYKAQQALQNQTFDAIIKSLQGIPVHATHTTYATTPAPAPTYQTATYATHVQAPAPTAAPVGAPPPMGGTATMTATASDTGVSATAPGLNMQMRFQ
ncbi:unnamed protein product [Moneuplotes crassus]|uniref:Uncharacterized protein n=1 Tax=Euplotes crassus TaxID=5936 RepID=A0AAD1U8F3_EUPCR|nr:unnamed protein product [Moneuplotes crassus]